MKRVDVCVIFAIWFSNDARKVYFSHILSCSITNNLMFFLRKSGFIEYQKNDIKL